MIKSVIIGVITYIKDICIYLTLLMVMAAPLAMIVGFLSHHYYIFFNPLLLLGTVLGLFLFATLAQSLYMITQGYISDYR